jgi:CheY-like chemotaxis protein
MSARVLVVDDSPTIRKVVGAILADSGYETLAAETGEKALEILRSQSVDLVLTDFVMPKMNGYQFCREVRSDEALRHLPVVLMSAKGDKIRGHFVEQTGAVDAITKPFDPLGLVAVVERALTRQEELLSRTDQESPPSSEDAAPPSIDLKPDRLELSEDPGLRRRQVAQQFAAGIAKLATPELAKLDAHPSDDTILRAIRGAITPEAMGKLAALLRVLDFGPDAGVILSGDLSFISIAEVLQMLELQRQTGALSIANADSEVTLYIRDGLLDLAQARSMPGSFRLGRYLVQLGALSRSDLANFLENRAGSKRLIGDGLVHLGVVTEEQVQKALRLQTAELVYEVVRWKTGRFTFARDAICPEATLAQLSLTPAGIVLEGFRRVDEWRLIEGSFDFDETLHPDPTAIAHMQEKGELTGAERAVLDALDGTRTVRQIVDAVNASTFDVCKILYQFLNSHLVRRRAA